MRLILLNDLVWKDFRESVDKLWIMLITLNIIEKQSALHKNYPQIHVNNREAT